ncbi:hypothetical protein [Micromonospora auratinigra]|uniref:Uncharacterized protein n=1 Tax=Micromonospora auratinigra TaxID=261654 RepID=A0A1A8ZF52_9ACTN|nr:hypothetical protein [Micromonospora auratinigra]SBT42466.1 hypothetical protein GA0070611_1994 [Micromonospora auratinigra]
MTGTSDDGGTDQAPAPAGAGAADPRPPVAAPLDDRPGRRDLAARLWDRAREQATGWWRGLRPLLAQFRWSDEPPPTVTTVDRRVVPALPVPAQGRVYDFVVRATLTWSSDSVRPELFGWYVDYFQPQAVQRLRRIAARCAARVAPHRPHEVEVAVQQALAADEPSAWRFVRGEVVFNCEPDVSVHLDERVRRLLQPYWDRRIALECERDLARRGAGYADDRNGPAPGRTPPPGGPGRRRPRPDSPVEQFTPLEVFPEQSGPRPPRPGPRPPRSDEGPPRPSPPPRRPPAGRQPGDPEHPGSPDR